MTSVILVQHNQFSLTRTAIRSFREHHQSGYEIIVVDNASTQEDPRNLAKEFPDVRFIFSETNAGFSKANNLGAGIARGEFLFFLNNDTVTTGDVLTGVESLFRREKEVGIVGPGLRYPDGRFQFSCGSLPTFGGEMRDKVWYRLLDDRIGWVEGTTATSFSKHRDVGWVTGAALFIRKDLFHHVGGFDEEFFMYFEDKDLCNRVLRAGKRVRYFPEVYLVHIKAGSSSGTESLTAIEYRRSQLRYYRKHRPHVENRMLQLYLWITGKSPGTN